MKRNEFGGLQVAAAVAETLEVSLVPLERFGLVLLLRVAEEQVAHFCGSERFSGWRALVPAMRGWKLLDGFGAIAAFPLARRTCLPP